MITTIAVQQVRSLRRRRVSTAAVGIMVTVTAMAGVIGWSGHRTIVRVYDEAVRILAAEGSAAPPNPFELTSPLALLSNMAIYIPLIGALIALILGHISMSDELETGIGRLIFSRRLSRFDYFYGKVAAVGTVLAAMLTASLAVGVTSLVIVNSTLPSFGQVGRLLALYGISWLYLLVFALIGMATTLLSSRRSLGLLSAIGTWLVITFVVPQFTSGLRPTASLNPVTDPTSTTLAFFRATAYARPLSIAEQYKSAAAHMIDAAPSSSVASTLLGVSAIAAAALTVGVVAAWLVARHDYSASATHD